MLPSWSERCFAFHCCDMLLLLLLAMFAPTAGCVSLPTGRSVVLRCQSVWQWPACTGYSESQEQL